MECLEDSGRGWSCDLEAWSRGGRLGRLGVGEDMVWSSVYICRV